MTIEKTRSTALRKIGLPKFTARIDSEAAFFVAPQALDKYFELKTVWTQL